MKDALAIVGLTCFFIAMLAVVYLAVVFAAAMGNVL